MKPTEAMIKELRWFADHGGNGVIDKYGRLLAMGELRNNIYCGSWLRLVAHGLLEGADERLKVSIKGYALLAEERNNQGHAA